MTFMGGCGLSRANPGRPKWILPFKHQVSRRGLGYRVSMPNLSAHCRRAKKSSKRLIKVCTCLSSVFSNNGVALSSAEKTSFADIASLGIDVLHPNGLSAAAVNELVPHSRTFRCS